MKRLALLLLIIMFSVFSITSGQTAEHYALSDTMQIMFWNTENSFWPEDEPGKDDSEFTPDGARHWTRTKLRKKLQNLSRVIMDEAEAIGGRPPALIGLAEVENDSVVRNLLLYTDLRQWHYKYVMTNSDDTRGIDVALVYDDMDFRLLNWEALRVEPLPGARATRDIIHAWGRMVGGDTLDVFVCHLPSRFGGTRSSAPMRAAARKAVKQASQEVMSSRMHPHIIIMGDMNDSPDTRQLKRDLRQTDNLVNLMEPLERDLKLGRLPNGTHKYQGEWTWLDQFWVNRELVKEDARIRVINPRAIAYQYLLTEDKTHLGERPKRSYYGMKYEGGTSDHLPISLNLVVNY